ncbi:uncharacterized protein LOC134345384 isoform X3 [Mobula hypostoma]|uniref:uncharacterized protein LOC134345384 isoform X3 n=2 Tax=Mobula hypostoma TaxID=723540 RepID=UPI002FC33766
MLQFSTDRKKTMGSKLGKRFAGLKNQGATCYLNTLLQTWFMTQEVKECIASCSCKEQDSLIGELRCLFEQLSHGNEWSLSTERLTSQLNLNVYEQRDIEECFRSLVNKLNSKMDQENNLRKESNDSSVTGRTMAGHFLLVPHSCEVPPGAEQEQPYSLVHKIYQVTMVNSLKCLKCTQSMDEDTFLLDIPLSVCSANAAEKFESMEKGLEQFLKEEKMEGDNKCYCNNCDMKTETSSRYYFKHLPQILTFQLKRFEFDYNCMAFQKITDCITFPLVLEFTRSQDVPNEWCLKLTVNRVNNGDVGNDEETPVRPQEEKLEDSEDIIPETPQSHSQQDSTGQEVNNVDVVKVEETPAQAQEVKQDHSVDITGGNPETPQDQSQQVSTGQEVNNVDVVKDEETPAEAQEVKQDHSVDMTGGNPETPQGHSQQDSTGQEVNGIHPGCTFSSQLQPSFIHDSVMATTSYLVNNVDVVKDEETPAEAQEVKQDHSVDMTGGNPETPQDQSQQVSTGQEVNNVDVVKDEETPAEAQEVKQDHSVDMTGGNPETPQGHSQQDSTGQEVNGIHPGCTFSSQLQPSFIHDSVMATTSYLVNNVDVVKDEETPAEAQEVKQDHSVDMTGGNPETPQDQSQQVSTGQEVNNVDVVKDEETPAEAQEVKQDHSVDMTGGNPETPQGHSQQDSTGQEVNGIHPGCTFSSQLQPSFIHDSVMATTSYLEKRYELFAIWHHIGGYGSGHYYAEIKSDSGDWYNFNDKDVKKLQNCLHAYVQTERYKPRNRTVGRSVKEFNGRFRVRGSQYSTGRSGSRRSSGSRGTGTRPGEGEGSARPGEGEGGARPGEEEDSVRPGEGEDSVRLGEGEDSVRPGEGEGSARLGEEDDSVRPGEGEDSVRPDDGPWWVW